MMLEYSNRSDSAIASVIATSLMPKLQAMMLNIQIG